MSSVADRNLLFGILALQMDFISREQLIAATSAWVLEKATPLDEILTRQRALHAEHRTLLAALVAAHLKQHDNDPQKSLAAVSSIESVRDDLKQLSDPEIERSLVHVSQDRHATDGQSDPYATRSVGESTSDGLRFRILRPHAKGGLGEVFVAEDGELHREVALKQIQSRHADDSNSRSRFMLEAEITGGLEHPGIVPVYGLGTYADGRPFYAMRFIRGDSLKDAIERFHGKLPLPLGEGLLAASLSNGGEGSSSQPRKQDHTQRTVEFRKLLARFIDVCNAIDYAHSRGVLHRDLKPGNIMLGKYGETLVVDWGLAKARGSDDKHLDSDERPIEPSGSGSAPTQMGSAIGTPQFMSPEQAAGRLDLLGPQSDVYSLGATLYCILSGQPPLASIKDIGEILRRVQAGDIPGPRDAKPLHKSIGIASILPFNGMQKVIAAGAVPKGLDAICRKAMALKPADRYSTPHALADDIEHWLADEPVSAMPDNFSRRLARWTRQHRALAQSSAAALLLITAVAIGAALLVNREREIAEHQRETAERLAHEKEELAAQERSARQRADESAAGERSARKLADEQAQLVLATLNSVVLDIQTGLGPGEARRDLLNKAIAGLKKVARSGDTAQRADHALVRSHLELGQTFLVLGGGVGSATEESLRQFQIALVLAEKLAVADPKNAEAQRDLSLSYEGLGDVNVQLGNIHGARDAYLSDLEISKKIVAANPKNFQALYDLGRQYDELGNANRQLGDVAAARDNWQFDLAICQKLAALKPENIAVQHGLSITYERLGDVNLHSGNMPDAREAYQNALAISKKLAAANPNYAVAQRDLSFAYVKLGNMDLQVGDLPAARDAYQSGMKISQKLAAADPKNAQAQGDLSFSYNHLGDVNLQLSNVSAARDAYQEGLEISQKLAAADAENAEAQGVLAYSLGRMGKVELKAADNGAAVRWLKQGIAIFERLDHDGKIADKTAFDDERNDLAIAEKGLAKK